MGMAEGVTGRKRDPIRTYRLSANPWSTSADEQDFFDMLTPRFALLKSKSQRPRRGKCLNLAGDARLTTDSGYYEVEIL
jgi:hypothetical protein